MADRFRIFEGFRSQIGADSLEDIEGFIRAEEAVEEYMVESDAEDGIKSHMTLKSFSFLAAKDIYLRLAEFMRRSCYNIYTSEETKEGVRYLFLTGMEGRDGIKMDITIDEKMNDE